MDDAWLGGDARPVELLPGLQPVIEMGARQYSSVIGRFLETDPIEGGAVVALATSARSPHVSEVSLELEPHPKHQCPQDTSVLRDDHRIEPGA